MHSMLSGAAATPPFSCGDDPRQFADQHYSPPDLGPGGISPVFGEVCRGLLRVDPTQRLTVAEAAEQLRPPPVVDVQVKLPAAGRTVTLSVRTDSTVGAIKAQLQGMSDGWCGSESMRLIFAGRELADEQSMLELAQDETCMHVLLRLPEIALVAQERQRREAVETENARLHQRAMAAEEEIARLHQSVVAAEEAQAQSEEETARLQARIRELEQQQQQQQQQSSRSGE